MKNEFGYVGSVGKVDYIAIMHDAKETVFRSSRHQNLMKMAAFSCMCNGMCRYPTQPNPADGSKNNRFGKKTNIFTIFMNNEIIIS